MDGLATADSCPVFLLRSRTEERGGQNTEQHSARSVISSVDPAYESAAEAVDVLGRPGCGTDAAHLSRLLESFDTVLQLHRRGEEIRTQLNKIDAILLESRTVAGLIQEVVRVLEQNPDLTAARILIRADHPVSSAFRWATPSGSWLISRDHPAQDHVIVNPFVLDDPAGDLSVMLFGESASEIRSAVVARLCADEEDLGLLCLASPNPHHYFPGMNTDLIAGLADKIALGIKSAWEHENAITNLLHNHELGIFSETFFLEYLAKEFNRTWRNRRPFSLVAVSWSSGVPGEPSPREVTELVLRNIRSADVAAQGDSKTLWLLLPDTAANNAKGAVERLAAAATGQFHEDFVLRAGITEFSKEAPILTVLLDRARSALHKAQENGEAIVVEFC